MIAAEREKLVKLVNQFLPVLKQQLEKPLPDHVISGVIVFVMVKDGVVRDLEEECDGVLAKSSLDGMAADERAAKKEEVRHRLIVESCKEVCQDPDVLATVKQYVHQVKREMNTSGGASRPQKRRKSAPPTDPDDSSSDCKLM